jgi:hypothetical protein
MSALRHKRPLASSKSNFRFTLESGLNLNIGACPESANCRQTLLKSLQEKPINNQRQGYTLQPLPTASPRGQARDPTRHIDAESFVFRPE